MPDTRVPWGAAYDGPRARALGEMMSCAADLAFAADAFTRAGSDRALWNAGVIAYARAFTSAPAQLLQQIDEADLDDHAAVLEAATKLIGVKDEGDIVLVLANPEFEEKAIVGVLRVHPKPELPSPERMAAVAGGLATWASDQVTALREGVLAAAQSENLDDLYKNARPLG